jgi:peptidoglycan/LPS O-acetylase OafA/YrhL
VNQKHLSHPKYRPDIDGLRAISILAVVAFHAFPHWVSGGFVGVDIFFVISGFLISSIIFGNLEADRFSYYEFYVRRIKRIFPALILVLAASYVFGWYFLLPDEYKQLGKHIAAGAGFTSNLALWSEAGYFDNASDTKPLLHLWSLGVEEQFYIFWPLLLGLVWKYRLNFLTITLLIAAASFSVNVLSVASHPVADFYSPLTRFWELMVGGILAYITLHKPHLLPGNTNIQSTIGLVLIATAIFSINKEMSFPGWWAGLPAIGAFLIISARPTAWPNRLLLGNRAMVSIGLISYPLYLWHWPILSFMRIYETGTPSVVARSIAIIIAFILAWMTYYFVEKRVRFGPYSGRKSAILLILMTLIGVVGFNTYQRDGLGFRIFKMIPEVAGTNRYTSTYWREHQCFLGDREQFSSICMETTRPLMFLWGDSHAAALYPGFKELQSKYHFGIAQYTKGACKPFIGEGADPDPECTQVNRSILSLIRKSAPDYVLLHANWSRMEDIEKLKATIDALKESGIKSIILIGPDPTWKDELARLIFASYRRDHKRPPIRMTENNAKAIRPLDISMRAFATQNGLKYFSSLDNLCNQDGCLIRTSPNSMDIMTTDTGHLSPQGAIYQANFVVRDMLKLAPAHN